MTVHTPVGNGAVWETWAWLDPAHCIFNYFAKKSDAFDLLQTEMMYTLIYIQVRSEREMSTCDLIPQVGCYCLVMSQKVTTWPENPTNVIRQTPNQWLALARWPTLQSVWLEDFFNLHIVEVTALLGTLIVLEMVSYSCPDLCHVTILSRRTTESSLDSVAWSLSWYAVCSLDPYRNMCVPFVTGLQSCSWHIPRTTKSNTTREFHSNCCEYFSKIVIFRFSIFNHFCNAKPCFHFVIMGYWI